MIFNINSTRGHTGSLLVCTVSIVTWGLDRYGHFNDVILNWDQVYSIGGATLIVRNLNNCPRANAFLCKKAAYIN